MSVTVSQALALEARGWSVFQVPPPRPGVPKNTRRWEDARDQVEGTPDPPAD